MTMPRAVTAFAVLGAAVAIGACGSSGKSASTGGGSNGTIGVSVGNATVQVPKAKPLSIALLMNGQSNQYQLAIIKAAKQTASSTGAKLTVLNANFDLPTQLNQIQSVATGGQYNAAIVLPVAGQEECTALTKTLPAAKVLVSVLVEPICGRDNKNGVGQWSPGTLNIVGGDATPSYYAAQMVAAATLNPGPQQVVYAVGPQLAPGSAVQIAAAKAVATKYPNLHIRDYVYTDWTTDGGYSTMLGYLHAHPKTTIVVSDYGPDLTLGVVKAVAAAGETGKIKVIDFGGSSQIVPLIKSGVVQATVPDFPSRIGQLSVQSLTDAQAGKQPVRFVSIIPKEFGSYLQPRILAKSNLNGYKPEF